MSKREMYLALLAEGVTAAEIARRFGISPETVARTTRPSRTKHAEQCRERYRRKHPEHRTVKCSRCGELGHNAATCKKEITK